MTNDCAKGKNVRALGDRMLGVEEVKAKENKIVKYSKVISAPLDVSS